jgi:hypothetical protein
LIPALAGKTGILLSGGYPNHPHRAILTEKNKIAARTFAALSPNTVHLSMQMLLLKSIRIVLPRILDRKL